MNFLGFIIDSKGYTPSLSKIEIIKNIPTPTTVKEIKRFVGMASFFRKHIAGFSTIVEPLTRLTRKNITFVWNDEQEKAFTKIKDLLAQKPSLIFPNYDLPFHIFTDASTVGQGGALMQMNQDTKTFSAISYCSRTLSISERKWPPVQIELGAIIFALRSFKPFIYNTDVELHTDHKPLAYLLKKAEAHPNLSRWLIELQNYQIKIVHIKGKQNSLADALSRIYEDNPGDEPSSSELNDIAEFPVCLSITNHPRITFDILLNDLILSPSGSDKITFNIIKEQTEDPEALSYVTFLKTNSIPTGFTKTEEENFLVHASNLILMSNVLYQKSHNSNPRLYIPISLRKLVFDSSHAALFGGGHLSVRKTLRKCQRFFWPRMYTDIFYWCRACLVCQLRNSPVPPYRAEMLSVPCNTIFAKVGLDLAGPFPITTNGNKYILNIICWFSKFIISAPLPDAKGITIAKAFLSHCVFKFGACTELITDNATAFTSEFFRQLCTLLSINKIYSIPHWSQGNSVTERTFRTYHNILAKYITPDNQNFDEFLDCVTFSYNTCIHNTTNESPYFLMFGRDPLLSIDPILNPSEPPTYSEESDFKQRLVKTLRMAWEAAANCSAKAQEKSKLIYDKKKRPPTIQVGDRVLLRNYAGKPGSAKKHQNPWKGIYRVGSFQSTAYTHALSAVQLHKQIRLKSTSIN